MKRRKLIKELEGSDRLASASRSEMNLLRSVIWNHRDYDSQDDPELMEVVENTIRGLKLQQIETRADGKSRTPRKRKTRR